VKRSPVRGQIMVDCDFQRCLSSMSLLPDCFQRGSGDSRARSAVVVVVLKRGLEAFVPLGEAKTSERIVRVSSSQPIHRRFSMRLKGQRFTLYP
jgi:hypothetical protein